MITPIADNLGNENCQALTALHLISGTDVCGSFYGKGKDSAWSTFQKAGPITVEALAALTKTQTLSKSCFQLLEAFVCTPYGSLLRTVGDVR